MSRKYVEKYNNWLNEVQLIIHKQRQKKKKILVIAIMALISEFNLTENNKRRAYKKKGC